MGQDWTRVALLLLVCTGLTAYAAIPATAATGVAASGWFALAAARWFVGAHAHKNQPTPPVEATTHPVRYLTKRALRALLVAVPLAADAALTAHAPPGLPSTAVHCAGGTVGFIAYALAHRRDVFNTGAGVWRHAATALGGAALSTGGAFALPALPSTTWMLAAVAAVARVTWLLLLSCRREEYETWTPPLMRIFFWAAVGSAAVNLPAAVCINYQGVALAVAALAAHNLQAPLQVLCVLSVLGSAAAATTAVIAPGVGVLGPILLALGAAPCGRMGKHRQLHSQSRHAGAGTGTGGDVDLDPPPAYPHTDTTPTASQV